jgi:hypothetical protein
VETAKRRLPTLRWCVEVADQLARSAEQGRSPAANCLRAEADAQRAALIEIEAKLARCTA